ncbi:MAG: hypothetical protein ACYDED_09665 [Ferrimicrobium sp.]
MSDGPFTGKLKEHNHLFMQPIAKKKAEEEKAQRKKEYPEELEERLSREG